MVRIAVAKFELTPAIPIFARIEVNAANIADISANKNHTIITFEGDYILFNHSVQG